MNEENKAHFTQLQSLWASADICFAVQNDKVGSEGTIKRLASIVKKFKLKINNPIEWESNNFLRIVFLNLLLFNNLNLVLWEKVALKKAPLVKKNDGG